MRIPGSANVNSSKYSGGAGGKKWDLANFCRQASYGQLWIKQWIITTCIIKIIIYNLNKNAQSVFEEISLEK